MNKYVVRKRPAALYTKGGKKVKPGGGVIYLPPGLGLVGKKVIVLTLAEYHELKRRSNVYEHVQKVTEEPWKLLPKV